MYIFFPFFLGHKFSLQAQNCQKPLLMTLLQTVDKTNSCSAPAITEKQGKGMLQVQGRRRDIRGEKGKSWRTFHPSQVKHSIMEVWYPLKGVSRSLQASPSGSLSPLPWWEHYPHFPSGMWAQGVLVTAHVQARALMPMGLLLCSTSSAPPCTHHHPNQSSSKQKGGGRSVHSAAA